MNVLLYQRAKLATVEAAANTEAFDTRLDSLEATEEIGLTAGRLSIALTANADGSETDTTENLPAGCIVREVTLEVTTAEATGGTKTLNTGIAVGEAGGDADGFHAAQSCAATGIFPGGGALVGTALATTAVSVVTTAASADWAEFVGVLHIDYDVAD